MLVGEAIAARVPMEPGHPVSVSVPISGIGTGFLLRRTILPLLPDALRTCRGLDEARKPTLMTLTGLYLAQAIVWRASYNPAVRRGASVGKDGTLGPCYSPSIGVSSHGRGT